MKTVRYIVKQRMRDLGMKPYDLAKAVKGKMTDQTVYNFVNGDTEINSAKLAFLLDALGLEIRPVPAGRKRAG